LVEVTGQAGTYEAIRKVEFTATYKPNGRTARQQTVKRISEVNIMSEKGKFYAPFWLYDTGCSFVRLTARLLGQGPVSIINKTIKFECGE